MKIGLLGYGKMGKMIEEIAIARGHSVPLIINSANRATIRPEDLQTVDAIIEFTKPDAAMDNIKLCLAAGTPFVVGTTGWYDKLAEVKSLCESHKGSLVYGSNFSVGVNMMFSLNEILAGWMKAFPDYEVSIEEVHHKQKLDAPSGTAITLAEGVLNNIGRKDNWVLDRKGEEQSRQANELQLVYDRQDGVPGTHTVTYKSEIDRLELVHEAFNRKGFALGAVIAAEFIKDKKGIFTARDIFDFK
jgi:4-hydroxy-tetrahydrodipicolinate reductase